MRNKMIGRSGVATIGSLMGLFALVPGSVAVAATYDASTQTVICQGSTKGQLGAVPPLTTVISNLVVGGLLSIKGKLGGCSSPSNPDLIFTEGKNKFKGTFNTVTNNALSLLGTNATNGTITLTWGVTIPTGPNSGKSLLSKTSTVTLNPFGAKGFAAAVIPGSTYVEFTLGDGPCTTTTPPGLAFSSIGNSAMSVVGSFGGTDAGATSCAAAVTSEALTTIQALAADPAAGHGVKKLGLGLVQIQLQ